MPIALPTNKFKSRLRSGPCQIGFWSTFGSPIATEIVGQSGFDWVVLDTEHGPADPVTTLLQLQALQCTEASACVRIASNDPVLAKKALDIGAQTIIVPQVDSAEDARRAVAPLIFPPRGARGVSTTSRASRYGAIVDYHRHAADELCVVAMIESAAALRALPEIIEVEKLDCVLFGPQDLAADMGFLAQPSASEVVQAIGEAVDFVLSRGKFPGVAVGSEAAAMQWIERGARFVTCGSDVSILARGAEILCHRLREAATRQGGH